MKRRRAKNPDAEIVPDASEEKPPDTYSPEPFILKIGDVLDLHTFLPREVGDVVRTYLEEARAKGFAAVRIVHGKGTGTQRAAVHAILKRTDFVSSFQDAPAEAGGWGATVVWFSPISE